jgi:hypothetical protein
VDKNVLSEGPFWFAKLPFCLSPALISEFTIASNRFSAFADVPALFVDALAKARVLAKVAALSANVTMRLAKMAQGLANVSRGLANVAVRLANGAEGSANVAGESANGAGRSAKVVGVP